MNIRTHHNAPNLNSVKRISISNNKGSLTQRNGGNSSGGMGGGFKLNVVSTPSN